VLLWLGLVGCAPSAWVGAPDDPEFSREHILQIIATESPITYRDGVTPIGALFDTEHRTFTPWKDIPRDWVDSIVAAEDGGYWSHHGVAPLAIARAAVRNVRAGRVVAGGSTLTQQTAKNLFYRPDRSMRSKMRELSLALRLEARFSKEEILEFYANQFHVAGNGRGLAVAARYFFDTTPAQLTTKQCAFLAGMVKAPQRYNPFLGETEERRAGAREAAEERTAYVLRRRVEEGTLDAETAERLRREPLEFRRGAFQFDRSVIVDEVERRLGEPDVAAALSAWGVEDPATSGLRLVTSLDRIAQEGAAYAVVHHLAEVGGALERPGMSAFLAPPEAQVIQAPGVPLAPRQLLVARVVRASAAGVDLDAGGRPCSVDAEGLRRAADAVGQPVAGWVRALASGTRVRASVRPGGVGSPRCDLEPAVTLQGAVVVLEDGWIRALVGGADNRGFNRALRATRPLGSTWKPLVYATALHLGWLPTDVLDNRRNVFPFNGTWYAPGADHARGAWIPMAEAGAHSENLASTWLLAHLTDRLNLEQLRRLAVATGLFPVEAPEPEALAVHVARLRLQLPGDRTPARAFTRARERVLADLAFGPHPGDADALRSMILGEGWEAEQERVLSLRDPAEREARRVALGRTFLAREAALAACGDPAEPADPPACPTDADAPAGDDLHVATLRSLRTALDAEVADLRARDPWDPEVVLLDPEVRTWLGIRALQARVAAHGVGRAIPTNLTVALGAGDTALVDMAVLYQEFLRGEARGFQGRDPEGRATGARRDGWEILARIEDADGRVLWRAEPVVRTVGDPLVGPMVGGILRGVVTEGTGRRADGAVRIGGRPVPLAGKTGTTNDHRDAAFVGWAPRSLDGALAWGDAFTVAAWVGYDDRRPMRRGGFRVQGSNGALPAWLGTVRAMAEGGLLGASTREAWSWPAGLQGVAPGVPPPIGGAEAGLPPVDVPGTPASPGVVVPADGARRYGAFATPG
jgi:membrane peptidoglycan carboxypeptidase